MLPLKHYDQQGRIKPLTPFLICLLFLARGYLVFIVSMTYRADTGFLLGLFYPQKIDFYVSLLIGLPAMGLLLLVIYRDKLWQRHSRWLFRCIKPLLLLTLIVDLIMHIQLANQQSWQFSWIIALTFLIDISWIYYFARSRYFDSMLKDWSAPGLTD